MTTLVNKHGRLDCVVCWMEYGLVPRGMASSDAEGPLLSFAPRLTANLESQEVGSSGGLSSPDLSPHVWQRVHYMSLKPEV